MKNVIMFMVFFLVVGNIFAQESTNESTNVTIEVDPIPIALGGFSAHFGLAHKKSKHMVYGISLAYGIKMPDAIINLNNKNKDQGWNVRINQGMGLWMNYHFKEPLNGWFAGLQVFTQELELQNDDFPGESDRTNTLNTTLQFGYIWYPFKNTGLFLRPWAGLGYQTVIDGSFEPEKVDADLDIGDKTYDLNPWMPFATVHIGYSFGKN